MLQVLQALLSLASRGKGQLQVLQALLPYVLLHKGLRVVAGMGSGVICYQQAACVLRRGSSLQDTAVPDGPRRTRRANGVYKIMGSVPRLGGRPHSLDRGETHIRPRSGRSS